MAADGTTQSPFVANDYSLVLRPPYACPKYYWDSRVFAGVGIGPVPFIMATGWARAPESRSTLLYLTATALPSYTDK